jgi:thioredoxin 1
MAGKIEVLDTDNFDAFIKKGNVVVDFYADWCGPCKTLGPEMEKAAGNVKEAKFGKLNIDGNQEVAMKFQVMSIPTVIFFKDGEQVDRFGGSASSEEIEKKVEKAFG